MSLDHGTCSMEDRVLWPEGEVAELPLFLAGWQAVALEKCASCRGLTTGQLIRLLIRECLAGSRPGPVSK
jgi:hypothetical protein